MLTQVLEPGIDQKGLDEASFLGRVLEHVPIVGAVTSPLGCERGDRTQEGGAVAAVDAVLDSDQDWSPIGPDVPRMDGLGPMQRRCEVDILSRLELPAPEQRNGQ